MGQLATKTSSGVLTSFHVVLNRVTAEKILFTYRAFPKVFA